MAYYSSSEAIDHVKTPDDNIEIRGYVDAVPGRHVVGRDGRRLNLFKFVINNNAGKRIQCLAWEKEIDRVEQVVTMNKILHIEAAQAKAIMNQRYNLGNAAFELTIRSITEIEDEGTREVEARPHVDVPIVEWNDIANREGEQVSVLGWIKCNFRESRHFNNESSFGFGSITDGHLKLEVRLTSLAGLPDGLQRGTAVKITGTVNYGSYLYVKLESGADVTPTGEDPLEPARLINITLPPAKRLRVD